MQTKHICVLHLPHHVVDDLFLEHEHYVDMQQEGIEPPHYIGKDQGQRVPNLLRLVTSTNAFVG